MPRVHILGASGSGTTTLAAALSQRLGIRHIDADALFWLPTDPPFTTQRPADQRRALLIRSLPLDSDWIFSGSATGWAAPVELAFDLIVFLRLEPPARMVRLRAREVDRYGARIEGGGDMAEASTAFLAWAEAYDSAGVEQRSLAAHEAWIATQAAPVLRLDSAAPVEALVETVLAALPKAR